MELTGIARHGATMNDEISPGNVRLNDGLGPNVTMPEPFDYCYEWDGPYGTRKFSAAQHNGNKPTRSVPLFTAEQMHEYAGACVQSATTDCSAHWRKVLAESCADERSQIWEAAPGGGCSRTIEAESDLAKLRRALGRIEQAQALGTAHTLAALALRGLGA